MRTIQGAREIAEQQLAEARSYEQRVLQQGSFLERLEAKALVSACEDMLERVVREDARVEALSTAPATNAARARLDALTGEGTELLHGELDAALVPLLAVLDKVAAHNQALRDASVALRAALEDDPPMVLPHPAEIDPVRRVAATVAAAWAATR